MAFIATSVKREGNLTIIWAMVELYLNYNGGVQGCNSPEVRSRQSGVMGINMDLNEAATILGFSRDEVKTAINIGIELPVSKKCVQLKAHELGSSYNIDDDDLDAFISKFEAEEPGRKPPVAVCRELLIEAKHSCAICGENSATIQFHHIIDFAKIRHFDPKHMLALCPNHHALCTNGKIDKKSQYEYKRKLTAPEENINSQFIYSVGPANFSWDDLREIIIALHASVAGDNSLGVSGFDFSETDIARKNELNRISKEYYSSVIVHHQPYFGKIQEFLHSAVNAEVVELYYQVVDELRAKIAVNRDENKKFEYFLYAFAEVAVKDSKSERSKDRRTLNILMSFMYVNCDIGQKE